MEKASVIARDFGLSLVGAVPWGTHLCQFYESKQDLIDILVPYFTEGLRSNEFCMWVTSPPLEVAEAMEALRKAVPNIEEYLGKDQLEIISYSEWYMLGGKFDANRVLQGWVEKEQNALKRGFEGLRLTGNTFWIERNLWESFVYYEAAVNAVIGQHKMLALCTYCLPKCSGTELLDVVRNHEGTLVKQENRWYLFEDAARRKAVNGALRLTEKRYSALFENMQDGFAYHKILVDDVGRPFDYVFLEVNSAFERLTGLKRSDVIDKKATEVLPGIEKDPADWIGIYGKVALTGGHVRFENFAEALQKWYQVAAYSPEKGYFIATFEDITERKKAEAETSWMASFPALNPNPVVEADFECRVKYANPAARAMFGDGLAEPCHPLLADWPKVLNTLQSAEGNSFSREVTVGENAFYQSLYLVPRVNRVRFYAVNINNLKRAQSALRESEVKFRTAANFTYDWEYWKEPNGNFVFVSPSCERITGYRPNEFFQDPNLINKIVHPEDKKLVGSHFDLIDAGKTHEIDFRIITRNGETRWISHACQAVFDDNGKLLGRRASNRDVTDRKKAEDALKESEERLKRSQEIAHLGSWELDLKSNKLTWSDEVYRIFGLKPQEFAATYEAFLEGVHPEDREKVDTAYSGSLREGRDTYEIEHRLLRKSTGEIRIVHEKCEHQRDASGKIVRSVGMVHDITERKKAEETAQKQAALIDLSPDATIVRKLNSEITFWSSGAEKIYGYTKAEALGKSTHSLLKTKFPEPYDDIVEQLKQKSIWSGELLHKSKDGRPVIVQSYWRAEKDKSGEIIEVFESNVDITDRKQMQSKLEEYAAHLEELVRERTQQLKDVERLTAIGETAGMVGHDLRNPLQTVTGETYLAKDELKRMPDSSARRNLQENIDIIAEQIAYMDKIVSDLQDFVRPITPDKKTIDLRPLLNATLSQVKLPENIQTRTQIREDLPSVPADGQLLRRVFFNLFTNAVQAMPEGGKLTVKAKAKKTMGGRTGIVISVEDTGEGIAENVKPKIFKPLFTTKSKGQGFGLAVCKRVIEAHGGTIFFDSKAGQGTRFTIELPT